MKNLSPRAACAIAGALLLTVIAGCGGGGSGDPPPPAALVITSSSLPDGVVGSAYNATVAATGGTGGKTFSLSAGSLPAGLSLNASTGAITGTPAAPAGTANFTVMIVDSGTPQQSDTQALTIDITDPLVITTSALATATIGAAYNQTVLAAGGTAPYTFTISAGSLPAGLSISSAGAISGPGIAAATNQTFTVRVADSSNPQLAATQVLSISVTLEITSSVLPDATGGAFYSENLQAQGGQPPYVNWIRTAGAMPAGIADPVAATGTIAGTPDSVCAAATSVFSVQMSDSAVPAASDTEAGLSITVNPATLAITTFVLPNGVVGMPYSAFVQVSGGVPPYGFATSGTLPSQLGPIDAATGEIAGTPDTAESRTFNVIVTDSCGAMVTQGITITINPVSLGRNDSIGTATALANGTFRASISPSGDPNTTLAPDQDFYAITTTGAATVTVDINAQAIGSPLDSVIEILAANGARLNTCVSPAFTSACVHDDENLGVVLDSILQIQVSGPTTFFVHVVDFRGDARPDLLYDIVISGAN